MPPLIFDQYRFKSQFGVSKECIRKLELYENLISKWQEKVNLISKVSAQDLWKRHFFDSAQLLNFIEKTEKVLVDLGSGAGFPGLVLALKFVESGGPRVHLVEANKKKALFLNEANQILNTNAIILLNFKHYKILYNYLLCISQNMNLLYLMCARYLFSCQDKSVYNCY